MMIYKYLNTDRIDVLKNKSIRFSQPEAFNDPFELKPVLSEISTPLELSQTIENHIKEIALAQEKSLDLDRKEIEGRLSAFVSANKGVLENYFAQATSALSNVLETQANKLIGVLSLTEKKDNLLMWSHYAESHKGFCVGFDSNHEFFNRKRTENDEFYHLRKVQYAHNRPSHTMTKMNGTDILLMKSEDWEYEQEWRMCSILEDSDKVLDKEEPPVHLFNFPTDAVKEVVIGACSSEEFTKELVELLKQESKFKHVKLYKALVSKRQYSLDFDEIKL